MAYVIVWMDGLEERMSEWMDGWMEARLDGSGWFLLPSSVIMSWLAHAAVSRGLLCCYCIISQQMRLHVQRYAV